MYHTTGLTQDQVVELCARVRARAAQSDPVSWPPILGLFKSVVVVLTYLRRNRVQAEIAESYRVSQPTISRAVTGLTARLRSRLLPPTGAPGTGVPGPFPGPARINESAGTAWAMTSCGAWCAAVRAATTRWPR
jgi:hypothetical protein